jgi:hypothetical protein
MSQEKYETTDLGFSAYLMMIGNKLETVSRKDGDRKMAFTFGINPDEAEDLKASFAASESFRFDSSMKSLRIRLKDAMRRENIQR